MILSRFRWYRRMRGGYWGQVTAPLGIFSRTRWVRCKGDPAPNQCWEFYPWAQKTMGNGYIDEWYSPDPYSAVPLSTVICADCKTRLAKTPIALLFLIVLPLQATPLLVTDLRDVKAYAETPEGRQRSQWLFADGVSLGLPLTIEFNRNYAATSDAQGGPGGSTASARAQQTSTMTDSAFAGNLAAWASGRANSGYYGLGTALSVFDVRFEVSELTQFALSASGNGTLQASLGQVGANGAWNRSGFSQVNLSGQLPPGLYEFRIAVSANALANNLNWIASDQSAVAFSLSFSDVALAQFAAVPEQPPWTVGLLVFGVAFCVMMKAAERNNP